MYDVLYVRSNIHGEEYRLLGLVCSGAILSNFLKEATSDMTKTSEQIEKGQK